MNKCKSASRHFLLFDSFVSKPTWGDHHMILCPASEDAETLDRSFILLCWKFQEPETID
jgi:hypothetical protein